MRGAPLFSGGHGGGRSRAAAPCRGTKWCWGVGFVTFPSSHRAALLWHSPTGAVTGHGVNTETHPVWSQPQPGLCHTARLGPGYLSLGPFLPLSPGLVRDSFTHTEPQGVLVNVGLKLGYLHRPLRFRAQNTRDFHP